jgi:hypothetical protein
MSLNPGIIYGAYTTCKAAGGLAFNGAAFDSMARGVANGVCQWGINQPANLALVGIASGTVGVGVINQATTKLVVPPNIQAVSSALTGAGMVGPLSTSLAIVTALAISQAFSSSGQYHGVVAGVGVGTDVSKIIVVNATTLIAALMLNLAATGGSGPALTMMAIGLGNGIAAELALGAGAGAVTGIPLPGPGTGPSTSVVV